MEVDDRDRGDEQQVLDQLRAILEDVEKKINRRMMFDVGVKVLACLVLVVGVLLVVWHLGGAR